jgi:xanthine dehydrogenase accessory factor
VFATKTCLPFADEVVVDWPNRLLDEVGSTLVPARRLRAHPRRGVHCTAIVSALKTGVGLSCGPAAHPRRRTVRLREAGVDDAALARLMSPIGLDLGARTPEETAISIVAEIIAKRTGRGAPSLRDTEGPIHR